MTTFQRILLQKLEVNPANDRHGDVGSESAALNTPPILDIVKSPNSYWE